MTTINYNNGKIYKIEPLKGEEGEIYIGSTTKKYLSQRMTKHREDYNRWKNGKRRKIMSFDSFDKYGINNCQIILLENCPCESKDQLHARESHYIKTLNCINICIPGRTKREYYEDKKEQVLERNRQYQKRNRQQISEKMKIPFNCECGSTCRINEKARHLKSKKHQAYVAYSKCTLENNI
jgi:hypothetical protein